MKKDQNIRPCSLFGIEGGVKRKKDSFMKSKTDSVRYKNPSERGERKKV